MARARTLHPGAFDDIQLNSLPGLTRWLFAGLWCHADCNGRIEDDPARLGVKILPVDRLSADVIDEMLADLARIRAIIRYTISGRRCIQIRTFKRHQDPHGREKSGDFLPPPGWRYDEVTRSWVEGCDVTSERSKIAEPQKGKTSSRAGAHAGAPVPDPVPDHDPVPDPVPDPELLIREKKLSSRACASAREREISLEKSETTASPANSIAAIVAAAELKGEREELFARIAKRHPCKDEPDRAAREFRKACREREDAALADKNHAAWLSNDAWSGRDRALHWFFVNGTWRSPPAGQNGSSAKRKTLNSLSGYLTAKLLWPGHGTPWNPEDWEDLEHWEQYVLDHPEEARKMEEMFTRPKDCDGKGL